MTLAELLVASGITLALMAGVFDFVQRMQASVQVQPEAADVHQRIRAGVEAMSRHIVLAGADLDPLDGDPLIPGTEAITVRYVAWDAEAPESHTYYVRAAGDGTWELRYYDGESTDVVVVENVTHLAFEYFDGAGMAVDPGDSAAAPIRRVRVHFRVTAALDDMRRPSTLLSGASVPELEVSFDIAPRSLRVD